MSRNLTDANIIHRGHNNYLTPEIWEEMHFREIFYGTLVFQQRSMISVGRHVGLKEDHFTPFAACPSKYWSGNLFSRLLVTVDILVATSKWSALVINSYHIVSETSEKLFARNWKQLSVKHTCTNTMRCFIWHPMTG